MTSTFLAGVSRKMEIPLGWGRPWVDEVKRRISGVLFLNVLILSCL